MIIILKECRNHRLLLGPVVTSLDNRLTLMVIGRDPFQLLISATGRVNSPGCRPKVTLNVPVPRQIPSFRFLMRRQTVLLTVQSGKFARRGQLVVQSLMVELMRGRRTAFRMFPTNRSVLVKCCQRDGKLLIGSVVLSTLTPKWFRRRTRWNVPSRIKKFSRLFRNTRFPLIRPTILFL